MTANKLEVGNIAPNLHLKDEEGNLLFDEVGQPRRLSDYWGRPVVLCFVPVDTIKSFKEKLVASQVKVVGVDILVVTLEKSYSRNELLPVQLWTITKDSKVITSTSDYNVFEKYGRLRDVSATNDIISALLIGPDGRILENFEPKLSLDTILDRLRDKILAELLNKILNKLCGEILATSSPQPSPELLSQTQAELPDGISADLLNKILPKLRHEILAKSPSKSLTETLADLPDEILPELRPEIKNKSDGETPGLRDEILAKLLDEILTKLPDGISAELCNKIKNIISKEYTRKVIFEVLE